MAETATDNLGAATPQTVGQSTGGASPTEPPRYVSPIVVGSANKVPWEVRRAFRTKCYVVAAIQFWVVLGGMLALDGQYDGENDDKSKKQGGQVILGGVFLGSLVTIVILFFVMKKHPWNYIVCALTTAQAIVFWTMVEYCFVKDHANLCVQMVAMMAGVITFQIVVVQVQVDEERECLVLVGGMVVGLVLAFIGDAIMLSVAGIHMSACLLPGMGTAAGLMALLFVAGTRTTSVQSRRLHVRGLCHAVLGVHRSCNPHDGLDDPLWKWQQQHHRALHDPRQGAAAAAGSPASRSFADSE